MMDRVNWPTVRIAVAFFLIGLCNNYGYVIMLSAAEDILSEQHGKVKSNATDLCLPAITKRECKPPVAEVLLSDNLPSLIVKLTFPFFMDRFPFGFRVAIVCLLQATSYFVVAFSVSIPMSLAGVVFVSLGGGLGEITFLGLSAHYQRIAIAGWSSGTGMAGLLGSFSYAFLTEPHMANLTPKVALLIQLFIPVLFAFAYFILLKKPESVYSPTLDPKSWIVPKGYDDFIVSEHRVPQRELGPSDRLKLILPMLHLMIPLAIVYVGEYMINQGMTQQIVFDCAHGFNLSLHSQYRWYQVLYQFGVFVSRSSIRLVELPMWMLYLLPFLQLTNMLFFFFDALYWFVPQIAIIFALIIFEGLFGGSSYVNTFHKIHNKVEPDVREYCLSAASMGDSIGVNFAAGVSIPLHYWMCDQPARL
ncbi:Battenin [Caenorhabditis elegans]|uniref:Battenin n=1 Tax=Caenorhabditis elegans TaxID=6239 RepID=G5EES1_CAEEL|nr:Battenin [Caenorhabditis elegans]AAK38268.1 CLN-3.3 [Caenorhabditis elegans]CCD70116.1 Battenin [Caenorhabditis elegans]|eukprot:NP_505237.1 Battenin [Caenorhabditis elegans]